MIEAGAAMGVMRGGVLCGLLLVDCARIRIPIARRGLEYAMKFIRSGGIATLLLLVIAAAYAAESPRIAGTYSNLEYNAEGGDLLGMELLLVSAAKDGYVAFVQIAEGGAPYAALVPLTMESGGFSFTLPPGTSYGSLRFRAVFEHGGMKVRCLDGCSLGGHLKHGPSYWR
ncbi:MAG: hypothetical protein ACREVL_13250 [Solimonas sp.]